MPHSKLRCVFFTYLMINDTFLLRVSLLSVIRQQTERLGRPYLARFELFIFQQQEILDDFGQFVY